MFRPSQSVSRSRARSGIALGLAVAAVAVTAAACSGNSGGPGGPDDANLRVGVIADSIGAVPFDIGTSTANHSFIDAGLTITVQTYTSQSDELGDLTSGKIDVAYGEYAQFLNENSTLASNDNLRVISGGYDAGTDTIGLLTRRGGPLPAWGPGNHINCKGGTTIAVPSHEGTEYLALANWLQSVGSPLPTICDAIHEVPNPQDAIAQVASGKVSAAALQEPYVTAGQITQGLEVAQDLATGNAAAVPVDGYFATKDFTVKFPRTTAIFAAVMARLQSSAGSRVAVETVLRNSDKALDSRVISAMQMGTYPSVVLPATLDIVFRLMSGAGMVNGQIDSVRLTDLGGGSANG
jgi:ABC-type nitrate/sulfonate/bicarbonate transport system substrate-binding protein